MQTRICTVSQKGGASAGVCLLTCILTTASPLGTTTLYRCSLQPLDLLMGTKEDPQGELEEVASHIPPLGGSLLM